MIYLVEWLDRDERTRTTFLEAENELLLPFKLRKQFGRRFEKIKKATPSPKNENKEVSTNG